MERTPRELIGGGPRDRSPGGLMRAACGRVGRLAGLAPSYVFRCGAAPQTQAGETL